MYFAEWILWKGIKAKNTHNLKKSDAKKKRKPNAASIYESDIAEEQIATKISVSNAPRVRGPVFSFNDRVLELRCGLWEHKRGLISILTAMIVSVLYMHFYFIVLLATDYLEPTQINPEHHHWSDIWLLSYVCLQTSLMGYFYLKYGLGITRLEAFTSRHMLVRFNRTTQQVYLHRPNYCGGTVILPWEGVIYSGANMKSIAAGMGVPLSLYWPVSVTGTFHPEVAFVGKMCNNSSEMHDEWEFIRRFMESGPDGLPRPRITSHFPWPWQAFTPQFEGLTHYFRRSSRIIKLGL
ncbi:MAG: hypothetical protein EOP49_35915, partial [Sphingobacteriales bacterium]